MSQMFRQWTKWTLILTVALMAMILGTARADAAPAELSCGSSVTVQWGDTLTRIARRCGTTVDALMAANPSILHPNLIFPGQVIQMPWRPTVNVGPESGMRGTQVQITARGFPAHAPVAVYFGPQASEGVFLTRGWTDATGTFITFGVIQGEVGMQLVAHVVTETQIQFQAEYSPVPITPTMPQPHEDLVYVVQPRDTLTSIARRAETTVGALLARNPEIQDPSRITVGQKLVIPSTLGGQTYTNPRYGYRLDVPQAWLTGTEPAPQGGPARDIEVFTLYEPGYGRPNQFTRIWVYASRGGYAMPINRCDYTLPYHGVTACRLSVPDGQNPPQELLTFQKDGVYYTLQMVYVNPAFKPVFESVVASFQP